MSGPNRLERLAMRPEQTADLQNRFSHHPPTDVTGPLHEAVRGEFIGIAHTLVELTPAGRHQSLMLTALQEAMMWANAAVACDTKPAGRPVRDSPQA